MRRIWLPLGLLLLAGGCWWGPRVDVLPPVARLAVLPFDILDPDDLQIVLALDKESYGEGDTLHWEAKLDNPSLKQIHLRCNARSPAEVLRFDQVILSGPLTGAELLRTRNGMKVVGKPKRELPKRQDLEPATPIIIEADGTVRRDANGWYVVDFGDVELNLPGPGNYEVYIPVQVDLGDRYTIGRDGLVGEQKSSNRVMVTFR